MLASASTSQESEFAAANRHHRGYLKPRHRPAVIDDAAFSIDDEHPDEGDTASDARRIRFTTRAVSPGASDVWTAAFALVDADNALLREAIHQLPIFETQQAILHRLKTLHEVAVEEGMSIAQASEEDLRRYLLDQLKPAVRPAISLLENGNLRALWKDGAGQQVGLQFRGDAWVQYVIFARTIPERAIKTYVGREKLPDILPLIEHIGLRGLIFR